MSEDAKKDEKKDDKKDAKAAPDKGGDKAKKSPPIGAILAVVVILAAGMGMGFFLSSLVKPKPKPADPVDAHGAPAAGGDAHGGDAAAGHDDGKGGKAAAGTGALLRASGEFDLEDLMSNVRGQQGRRFIKMGCVLWVESTTLKKMQSSGGAAPGENVKRILKAAFEEHLKTYDLEDLTGINIYKLLEKSFKEIADRELRSLFDKLPSEPLVNRVVLTNMLVQ
jgi:hypothetical protein